MKPFLLHTLTMAAMAAGLSSSPALAQPPSPASEAAHAQAVGTSAHQGAMSAQLFYEVLVGELAAQRGDLPSAYALLLDAARRTQHPELFARAAGMAMVARDGPAALAAAQAWRKAHPDSQDAARLELQVLAGMNRTREMVQPIRDAIANSPAADRPGVILALPVLFARSDSKAAAVSVIDEALEPALADSATRGAAWVTKGRMRLLAGDDIGALHAVREARRAAPKLDAVALLAIELMSKQPDAEAIVRDYLNTQTDMPVRLAYASALYSAKRVDDAQVQLQQATREAPQHADGWLLLGEIQLARKQRQDAETALRNYLRLADQAGPAGGTPRGINAAVLNLAELAMRDQRPTDAKDVLNQFKEADATIGQQLRRAKLLADLGDLDAGRAALAALPEGSPEERRDKTMAMAQFLRETGQPEQAYTLLLQLLSQRATDTDLLYDAALAAEKTGDFAAMERHLRRIIELDPDHYNAYNALGYAFADRNERLDEARVLLDKAIALSPESPHIIDSLGWLEYRQGRLDAALRLLEKAYAEFPDAEVAAHLGEVLWMRGDRARAERLLQEALQDDPRNPLLRATIERLKK